MYTPDQPVSFGLSVSWPILESEPQETWNPLPASTDHMPTSHLPSWATNILQSQCSPQGFSQSMIGQSPASDGVLVDFPSPGTSSIGSWCEIDRRGARSDSEGASPPGSSPRYSSLVQVQARRVGRLLSTQIGNSIVQSGRISKNVNPNARSRARGSIHTINPFPRQAHSTQDNSTVATPESYASSTSPVSTPTSVEAEFQQRLLDTAGSSPGLIESVEIRGHLDNVTASDPAAQVEENDAEMETLEDDVSIMAAVIGGQDQAAWEIVFSGADFAGVAAFSLPQSSPAGSNTVTFYAAHSVNPHPLPVSGAEISQRAHVTSGGELSSGIATISPMTAAVTPVLRRQGLVGMSGRVNRPEARTSVGELQSVVHANCTPQFLAPHACRVANSLYIADSPLIPHISGAEQNPPLASESSMDPRRPPVGDPIHDYLRLNDPAGSNEANAYQTEGPSDLTQTHLSFNLAFNSSPLVPPQSHYQQFHHQQRPLQQQRLLQHSPQPNQATSYEHVAQDYRYQLTPPQTEAPAQDYSLLPGTVTDVTAIPQSCPPPTQVALTYPPNGPMETEIVGGHQYPGQQSAGFGQYAGGFQHMGMVSLPQTINQPTAAQQPRPTLETPNIGHKLPESGHARVYGPVQESERDPSSDNPNTRTGSQKKKKGTYTESELKKVNKVRQDKSCIRCQFLKIACTPKEDIEDGKNMCQGCEKVVLNNKQRDCWRGVPCMRIHLTGANLVRIGNSKFNQENVQPPTGFNWDLNDPVKTLVLGRGPPLMKRYWPHIEYWPYFTVECRRFRPKPNDLTFESWRDERGKRITLHIEPFAAVNEDLDILSKVIADYMARTRSLFLKEMIVYHDERRRSNHPLGNYHDDRSHSKHPLGDLIHLVFTEAKRYSEDKLGGNVLDDAIDIWILTRISKEGFYILQGTPYGQGPVTDPKSVYFGMTPVSPILDHQIDAVTVRLSQKLKDKVLGKMRELLAVRKDKAWYEIFLAMFVLMDGVQYLWSGQRQYLDRHRGVEHGDNKIGENVERLSGIWMAGWEEAAKNLVVHFKVALKGHMPFTFPWERDRTNDRVVNENRDRAGMDESAVVALAKICRIMRERPHEFEPWTKEKKGHWTDQETPRVWASQLFRPGEVE